MKVCPQLKNGKTLCDIWSLFREYGFEPLGHNTGLLIAEIALFIGFVDENETKEFEEGLKRCKDELFNSVKSE